MRSIQQFAQKFFLSAVKSEAEKALLQNIVALDGFRGVSIFDLTSAELSGLVKLFTDQGFSIKRCQTKHKIFGDREVKVNNILLYHDKAFRGAFAYVPSYKLGFFSWSVKNTTPFAIPNSFFDNVQRAVTGSPFDDWLQTFPSGSGIYRDGINMCHKLRRGIGHILKAHPPQHTFVSKNPYSLSEVHNQVTEAFRSVHKKDNVRILHLHEDMSRSIQVNSNILSSRFDLSEIKGLVIDSENDLVGYFQFSGGGSNILTYFSFYDEQGESNAHGEGQHGSNEGT